MATVTLHGTPFTTSGDLPAVGEKLPECTLCTKDMEDKSLDEIRGKKACILSIYPSVDTPVCATAAKKFNEEVSKRGDILILSISKDLPMASSRFCAAEGVESIHMLSAFRDSSFGKAVGVEISEGPLRALFARALLVIDENGEIKHSELVTEISEEPDYEAALSCLSEL